ncbi:uncharacterized protein KY384_008704 [Bacidia gigantensis]|uniref:uncharacterized protein n=1 Tax=Bacidia gigantensis TaxID=2732470 RepID=UPI001D04B36D|nr:uncharacterized protein KY384_008704 [Bacidia gigantensis]KAG8526504.1 hypothetical protein KY384_008704 [Bacidia gigantensis]
MFANACQLTAISVGYRHAPEDPHPAANHDCFDAAEYLVDHAERDYGARLLFIAGESAGGCLAALTTFHLIQSRPAHRLAGVILLFGVFDLTLGLPQMSLPESTRPLVTNAQMLHNFINAYTPGMSDSDRRDASVSPLYEDMQALADSIPGNSLPAALFLCGTADPLLDDTFLMGMKWMIAGGEAIVKIYPGGAHGFSMFRETKDAEEVAALQIQFVNEKAANEV